MTIEEKLEKKFVVLLARKLKNEDVKADIDAMSQEELATFKAWISQTKHNAEAEIWYKKQKQRAEDFARKFGISNEPE
jgi:hypothetical protein